MRCLTELSKQKFSFDIKKKTWKVLFRNLLNAIDIKTANQILSLKEKKRMKSKRKANTEFIWNGSPPPLWNQIENWKVWGSTCFAIWTFFWKVKGNNTNYYHHNILNVRRHTTFSSNQWWRCAVSFSAVLCKPKNTLGRPQFGLFWNFRRFDSLSRNL